FCDTGAAQPLLAHVRRQMRVAAAERRYERAEALRRRAARLGTILRRLGGVLEATHARPRLVLAPHPGAGAPEAFWLVGGRLVDHGGCGGGLDELEARTRMALARDGRAGEVGAHVPPGEVDEVRIVGSWLASHPHAPQLDLRPTPRREQLVALLARAGGSGSVADASGGKRELDDDRFDRVGADLHV
ncbi:MAG: hypothetical protein ACRDMJ_15660, partial [Solirubrobacteraceae bacterium]